jgi:hypothetical protein
MLVFSIVVAILSIWSLAVSINDTWKSFTPAERENWRNLGMALTRKIPGNISTAVGWLASSGISFFAYRAQIRSERREEELKNAFGQGLWGGYAINFFGRAVQELRAAGITPIIVFVSPSYSMMINTTYDYKQFLKDLPAALARIMHQGWRV